MKPPQQVTPAKDTLKESSQQVRIIQQELKEVRITLTQKEEIFTELTTIITKIVELREGNATGEWWKKLPRRNQRLPEEIAALYKMIDAFK